ncbi:CFEM domain-containing protein [Colletotrichum abscissum]|uniref:CFEM domain-containing protein n=1 Tax=Colletotrichum abscissum TaxID=1671311 RepID=UPI0027D53396|nr:CFEM domain-containing protein [Colletotrichum abscissum]KAK1503719.1 CFEM domain-containing protein [Colletotrichum abscissum]
MRTFGPLTFLLCIITIAAGAIPSISDYPPCAVTCIVDALPQSPCTGLNQTCLCADPVFNDNVGACVNSGCTVKDGLIVANMTWANCGFPLTDNTAIPRFLTGTLFILPVIFMCIRILNKFVNPSPWGADDVCIFIGFVSQILDCHVAAPILMSKQACATALVPIVYRLLAIGLGRDIWTLQPYKITEFLKILFSTQIFYITGLSTIKASILFFYLRIFPSVRFRRVLWATQGFNALLLFLYLILTFTQCRPLNKYWLGWDGEQAGVCMDFNKLVLTHVGFNILLDIWMLALPLTQLYKLNLGFKKKLGVILMFSVGLFLTAISALRIQVLVHFATANNITSEALWVYVWSLAELDVGVFVACMPSASQLWRCTFSKIRTLSHRSDERSGSTTEMIPSPKRASAPKARHLSLESTSSILNRSPV